ncbi:MAG: nucleotidyl transferase AbiEii/AbiGii toxin family protein [Acidobacteria bacterium]|nr:nucleotidyl transferase AbiEii/AbiGii toxin family protein [Acidobacteriota bacterium]
MRALEFWKAISVDRANFLESLIALLAENQIRYCVIGGQGVNAYVEPLVSLDLDLVVAIDQIERVESLLADRFAVQRFPHRINVSVPESKLRVQIQTGPGYPDFVQRASVREVLGLSLPVAQLEDVLQGKVWAALDPSRRPSKQKKDLLDIARLLEAYPNFRDRVPAQVLD